MLSMSLNHMTIPQSTTTQLIEAARDVGCVGVELRNDLEGVLFDGKSAAEIAREADQNGLRILALAEVYAFNDNTIQSQTQVEKLASLARDCAAEAIALIPRIANKPMERGVQRKILKDALKALQPMIEDKGITALIEPLGFANSSLRYKEDVVAVFEDLGRPNCFSLIHDTFHHTLAGETAVYANETQIVHISGVTDPSVALSEMTDAHRGLVDINDRLRNTAQISTLIEQGFQGPFSFEAFSTDVHEMKDPTDALLASTAFINSQVLKRVA